MPACIYYRLFGGTFYARTAIDTVIGSNAITSIFHRLFAVFPAYNG